MATTDKLLFTPGPLTTSPGVKAAMTCDMGSRDQAFIDVIREIRERLLTLAGVSSPTFEAIPIQGSGTYGIESVLTSVTPPSGGRWLVLVNGAYGRRICQILQIHGIAYLALECEETQRPTAASVEAALLQEPSITHIAMIHCETTTGIINDLQSIGDVAKAHDKIFFVDAMSSFGGIPIDMESAHIDYLVSSSNKCIEGVPGFSFALARRALLLQTEGWARTLSLDLFAQWKGLEQNGQFRFTPPIQSMLAFVQALRELEAEGGVSGRHKRYCNNQAVLLAGMEAMGFFTLLGPEDQSPIITTFLSPQESGFDFDLFYRQLSEQGLLIYPGKLSKTPSFRIGTIGRLEAHHMTQLLDAMRGIVAGMGLQVGVS